MRKLFLFILAALFLGGCAAPQPQFVPTPAIIAPQDNLLVDCDVPPPPDKAVYMKDYAIVVDPSPLLRDNLYYLNQYLTVVKGAQARETLLTDLVLKSYEHLDVCNQRWAKLREWKANAIKQVGNKKE